MQLSKLRFTSLPMQRCVHDLFGLLPLLFTVSGLPDYHLLLAWPPNHESLLSALDRKVHPMTNLFSFTSVCSTVLDNSQLQRSSNAVPQHFTTSQLG